ncbi:ATP-binding protein [Paenochrobactrum sp. BZR 588]|uniref:ATP-binding protein n=1 Tax=unclassified Paenochrobactrum TaxID=2639760 RepID=UPI003852C34F
MAIYNPEQLVHKLLALGRETEWVEFKNGNDGHELIGKYASSLANSAIFCNKDVGYLIWGIDDTTLEIVGTNVRIDQKMVGNDTFLYWLNGRLDPRVTIDHASVIINKKNVEILAISPGYNQPVRFNGEAYIRIDNSLQPLKKHSERERAIWQITNRFSFEQSIARHHLSLDALYSLFQIDELLIGLEIARSTKVGALEYLVMEGLVSDNNQGGLDVTNLLVLACANSFLNWPGMERKGVRVIVYSDKTKLNSKSDIQGRKGYGIAFNPLLEYVMTNTKHREEMQHGRRATVYDIPKVAVREIIANAIIHQDLTAPGDGPVVEIYTNRIKITNPGIPLIDPQRFIDAPSRSRNPQFGNLMRRLGLCEERGSGVDRALMAIEKDALPAPTFQVVEGATVVTLFGPQMFADMSKDDRVRACYQHACLAHERGEMMSNSSFRARMGLSDKQYPQISIVISDTKEAGLIRPLGEDQANRNAKYVPYWA